MFTVEEYRQALTMVGADLTAKELGILRELYAAPHHAMRSRHLALHFGYTDPRPFNSLFGHLAHRLCDAIGKPAPKRTTYGKGKDWYKVLAHYEDDKKSGGMWIMHPPLAEALENLELFPLPGVPLAEEIDEPDMLPEGAKQRIVVNAYERNREARHRCLQHYGARCVVCNFDFEAMYGEIGTGYIHVHHLRPLSTITESYSVDPIADLCPVCPNCHVMLHTQNPPYTTDELRAMIAQNVHLGNRQG